MTDRASAAISTSTPATDAMIGRVVGGRFKITALIARGGMGKVYRADQAPLGRVCAVKILNPSYAGEHDPEFHKRFFLEASIASKLTHPNTVTIFDYGRTDDDIYYMAMEYLEGHTLHRAIRQSECLPEVRTVHIARQVCRALREAHALGVIHRDLKPANVFLVAHGDEADFVKVLDFGLVKLADGTGEDLTQTGMFMGSPKYMSPEQIRGDKIDARSDIYALGIMIYEMLTGKVPFDRPNSVNILMAHVGEEPPPMHETNPAIQVSAAIQSTVARCLAKDPARRFHSMDELLSTLKRIGGPADGHTITGLEATERGEFSAASLSSPGGFGSSPGTSASVRSLAIDADSIPSLRPPPADLRSALFPTGGPKDAAAGSRVKLAIAAALGLAGAAGIAIFLALRTPAKPQPAPKPPAVVVTAAAPTSIAPAPVATPVTIASVVEVLPPPPMILRIATDPDGASVKEDGVELCPATPCDVTFSSSEAPREHKLVIARAGYRAESRTTAPAETSLSVKLAPLPRPAAPAPPPRAAEAPPPVPTGYKPDIPY